jgi:aminopeptidase N
MVLHMLRWICSDSSFFAGVRNYLADPNLAYSYAKTADLQAHLEAASGKDLGGFFKDWYIGQGYPTYQINWSQNTANQLFFTVKQVQSHPSVSYFELPLPVRLIGTQGQIKDIVLNHSTNGQSFQEYADFVVVSVEFDPDLWLISKNNSVLKETVGTHSLTALGFSMKIEPNPATGSVLHSVVVAPQAGIVAVSLENAGGRRLFSQNLNLVSGENHFSFDVSGLPPGMYFLSIKNTSGAMVEQVIIH